MATHYVSILQAVNPDTSGLVYREPYTIKATNDQWAHQVWILEDNDSSRVFLSGVFRVPENYAGSSASIVVEWTAQVTTGNAVWDFDYRAVGGNDTESMDQSGTQESATVTDAAPSAVNERLNAEISLTASNLAAGDLVEYKLVLDGSDANCTISEPCTVFGAYFKYADA